MRIQDIVRVQKIQELPLGIANSRIASAAEPSVLLMNNLNASGFNIGENSQCVRIGRTVIYNDDFTGLKTLREDARQRLFQ